MQYTRIYADAEGESHFEDVAVELAPADFAPPAPPVDVSGPTPADRYLFFRAPAGWYGDWHPAPRRQLFFCAAGEIEATVSDGEIRHFSAGAIALLDDVSGRGHATRVIGDVDAVGVFVQLPA